MRYIVGYAAGGRGEDALNLATSLAMTQGAQIDLVTVVDRPSEAHDVARQEQVRDDVECAAGTARAKGVNVTTVVKVADSTVNGLLEHAAQTGAGLIVVGATQRELLRRFTVGTVANSLLHSSPIPVALATRGYLHRETLERMSVGIGARPGADALIDVALETARRRGLPLRFISLIGLDADTYNTDAYRQAARHVSMVRQWAIERLPEGHEVTTEVVRGENIEDAMDQLDWEAGEFMMLGSSRLAQGRRIFMGSTANKILRSLPVPMVVVPRDYHTSALESRV